MLSRFHGVGVSLVALAFASAAAAQEVRPGGGDTQLSGDGDASSAVGGGVEDIVVTAQRRNENLQKVPIAVQAFSETELEAAGITSTVDLARITPGLTYGDRTSTRLNSSHYCAT